MEVNLDGIKYELNSFEKTAIVIKNKNISGQVVIPETIEYESVKYCITTIGNGAFYECTKLKSITLPNSIKTIERVAFCGCVNLTNVNIPTNVSVIESNAFTSCESLQQITIPKSVVVLEDTIFSECFNLQTVIFEEGSQISYIDSLLFCECRSLKNISLPNTITKIETKAFNQCIALENILIPNSVKTIGFRAFNDCKSLKSVTLPSSIKSIGDYAFSQLIDVKTIDENGQTEALDLTTVCGNIDYITNGVYYSLNISNKTAEISKFSDFPADVVLQNEIEYNGEIYIVSTIGNASFYDDPINSLVISEGIKSSESSFSNLSTLKYVKIPKSFTKIPYNLFHKCSNIEEVECDKGAKLSIVENIVNHSKKLKFVILDQGDLFKNEKISEFVFRYVFNNPDVYEFDKVVKSLKKRSQLVLFLLKTLKHDILSFLFDNNICTLEVAKEILDTIKMDAECKALFLNFVIKSSIDEKNTAKISIEKKQDIELGLELCTIKDIKKEWKCSVKDNTIFFKEYIGIKPIATIPGAIDGISNYVINLLPKNTDLTELIFLNGTNSIELGMKDHYETFINCPNISKIVLPQSLQEFRFDYKMQNNIEILTINELGELEAPIYVGGVLLSLGDSSVTEFNVAEGTKNIQLINSKRYENLEKLTLPNTLESIGAYCFAYCPNLLDFTIPKSVKRIGKAAFLNCKSLINMIIPDGITNIPELLFSSCGNLNKVLLPQSIDFIGEQAFSNCSKLENIEIPKKVSAILSMTFLRCISLKEITIPNNVTKIEKFGFSNCSSLTSLKFEDGINLQRISWGVFNACNNLDNVYLPDGLIGIGEEAFKDCSSLSNLIVPNTLEKVHKTAFANCKELKNRPKI